MSSSPLRSLDPPGSAQLRGRLPRLAGDAVERARLRVVARPARAATPRLPFVVLVSMLLVGGVVGLLLFNTSMQQASFAASSLEQQARTLDAREQELRSQLEGLRDPQRLARTAARRGMVIPAAPCFLPLGGAPVEGVCTPASPEDALPVEPPPIARPAAFDPPPVRAPDAASTTPPAPSGTRAPESRVRDGRGDAREGARDGRNRSQQSQQPRANQQSQQNQQSQRPAR
ncbi:hypothetical protein [Nocardioides nanhaiensis]|uniref:Cell division protein FtsL n=1 Tax=Nocardioides nanhaiensis TaxID=1476871 RepID=A0ABP8WRT6_9ACTN